MNAKVKNVDQVGKSSGTSQLDLGQWASSGLVQNKSWVEADLAWKRSWKTKYSMVPRNAWKSSKGKRSCWQIFLSILCSLSRQISFRVQNSAVVESVINVKLINSETQENKAHPYGIHYCSGRAKPVRFILQTAWFILFRRKIRQSTSGGVKQSDW